MGHAISRTKPSILAFDLFARDPSIDVFCEGWGVAVIDAIPQPANKQKSKIRIIRPPFPAESKICASKRIQRLALLLAHNCGQLLI
jgi:hypothetical protein